MADKDWDVRFDDEFEVEFAVLEVAVQDKIFVRAKLLRQFGPNLPRPYADTLDGSKYVNMKELRALWARKFGEWLMPSMSSDALYCCVPAIKEARTARSSTAN